MGLGSVLRVGLSGMAAAELTVQVLANNLANMGTPGFKASSAILTTQAAGTLSTGSAPSATSAGTDPRQVGMGVRAAAVTSDFSQGPIVLDGNPLSVAIQGEGMLILEGPGGERFYTRDGRFGRNAAGELISASGHRVLGYAADEDFQIQRTELVPLQIPAGLQAPAQDGSAAMLTDLVIGSDGRIRAKFSDGTFRDVGQIRLARFSNPSGLAHRENGLHTEGPNSGPPVEADPGEAGAGKLIPGAVELSNADVGESLMGLSLASNVLRANVRVVDTAGALLDDLVHVARRRP